MTEPKRELDFALVDDLAFAAERGRLDLGSLRATYFANAIGPYLELLQLQRGGAFPDFIGSQRFDLNSLAGLHSAVARDATRWICGHSGKVGALRAESSALDWTAFAMDAKRAAVDAGLSSDWAAQMVAAIGELRDNIGEHSGASQTGYVVFRGIPGRFEFVASDLGAGVLATIREAPDYQALSDHGEALRLTLTEGASRFGFQEGRGYGFRPLFTGLANRNAALRFRSGNAMLRIDGTSPALMQSQVSAKATIKGFFVSVSCTVSA